MKTQLGYCCINLTLRKNKITTNRGMIKKTFDKKGLSYVSELSIKNIKDLIQIIHWNYNHNIFVYRMSSDILPWGSEYKLSELPEFKYILSLFSEAGQLIKKYKQRVSFHPGPFNVLASPNNKLVLQTINELNRHAEIMDMMNLDKSYRYPINIHCNGVYGNKINTLNRFLINFKKLSDSTKHRLVVENDDKSSMYSVKDLYEHLYQKMHIPITFDYYHHTVHPDNLSEYDAFKIAVETWNYHNIKPLFHYSSSKKINENHIVKNTAHADFIYEHINDYNIPIDIELEAKAKELALFNYLNLYS